MHIRTATETDLPRIVEIYNSSIPERVATADLVPVSVDERRDWFRRHGPDRPLCVCQINGRIAGWFSFETFYGRAAYRHTAEISMYIAPESRGKGLGRTLLDEVIRIAPTIDIRSAVAYVFAHNEASRRLLEGAGFSEWGHLPRIAEMDGAEYDLLIMGKRLDGTEAG